MEETKLGRFELVAEIGRGAMGIVYKAKDPMLERTVAIKTINMGMDKDGAEMYEKRFYQEARAAGGLNHPNIVTVYDIGKTENVCYMAMEYIEGPELRTLLLPGKPLTVQRALSIAAQVAEGLAYAHERGVVHRDIKPANIMVPDSGPVKITDFGIARMRSSNVQTQTGMMMGSPKYMSPEQVIGKRADHRSDIFSLGVILYEMLCGATPFNGENVTALMYQIVNFAPPAPSTVNSAVPELLDYIVAKMLAKPIDERYQGGHEVSRDLRQCEAQLGVNVSATQPPLRTPTLAGLASGAQPELALTHAESKVIAQTVSRTRGVDAAVPAAETAAPPARGVSHSFDSLEATQRLAVLTGTAAAALSATKTTPAPMTGTAPGTIEVGPTPAKPLSSAEQERQTATQAIGSIPRPVPRTWRRRDWLLVGGAALAGLLIAGTIIKRRD
jgi:serine/threonine-protein kinase